MHLDGHAATLALLVVAACTTDPVDPDPTPARQIEVGASVRYTAVSSTGEVPHTAWVRAVNELGAPVGAPELEVALDGAPRTVAFDAFGYGAVTVDTPGSSRLSGVEDPVDVHVFAAGWPGIDAEPAVPLPLGDPGPVAVGGDGVVIAQGSELWWAGSSRPPHRVLSMEAPLMGLVGCHVDADTVGDVLAWTRQQVVLLRGRPGGGLGFGVALAADGHTVSGAGVGDVTGDRVPDLVVAWAGTATGVLDVWAGDGRFGFEPRVARTVDAPGPVAVVDRGAGGVRVLVLDGEGGQAWAAAPGGRLRPAGPALPEGVAPGDAVPLPPADTDGNGEDELWLLGAELRAVEADGVTLEVPGPLAQVALADAVDDRIADVWLVDGDAVLSVLTWIPALQERRRDEVLTLPGPGPVTPLDGDSVGAAELVHVEPGLLRWWRGDPRVSGVGAWRPRGVPEEVIRSEVLPELGVLELDDDPDTVEIAIVSHQDGDTRLKVLQLARGESRATQLGALRLLGEKRAPTDLAVCGTEVFVALDGRGYRVQLRNPTTPRIIGGFGEEVRRLACLGGVDEVSDAAWLQGDELRLVLGGTPSTEDAAGAVDLALAPGPEGPVVATCDAEACVIDWLDDREGELRFVVSDAAGTRVQGQDGPVLGDLHGPLHVADVDGNGEIDVLGVDRARNVWFLHRNTGSTWAPAQAGFADGPAVLAVRTADGDGDGALDLLLVDRDGDLSLTRAPGAGPLEVQE